VFFLFFTYPAPNASPESEEDEEEEELPKLKNPRFFFFFVKDVFLFGAGAEKNPPKMPPLLREFVVRDISTNDPDATELRDDLRDTVLCFVRSRSYSLLCRP
jgi:hypothetical protein